MGKLRKYDNPPIVQVMVTVQFSAPIGGLSLLDIASLYERFEQAYPNFSQIGRAGAMIFSPYEAATINVSDVVLPRVQFLDERLQCGVLFQEDRLSFLWNRIGALDTDANYPLFDAIKQRTLIELDNLRRWLSDNSFPDVLPAVAEVGYSNAFSAGTRESGRRVSDVFTYLKLPVDKKMSVFQCGWQELLRPNELSDDGKTDGITGQIIVNSGPGTSPDGRAILLLNLTAVSSVDSWEALTQILDEMHDRVGETFDNLVEPAALEAR